MFMVCDSQLSGREISNLIMASESVAEAITVGIPDPSCSSGIADLVKTWVVVPGLNQEPSLESTVRKNVLKLLRNKLSVFKNVTAAEKSHAGVSQENRGDSKDWIRIVSESFLLRENSEGTAAHGGRKNAYSSFSSRWWLRKQFFRVIRLPLLVQKYGLKNADWFKHPVKDLPDFETSTEETNHPAKNSKYRDDIQVVIDDLAGLFTENNRLLSLASKLTKEKAVISVNNRRLKQQAAKLKLQLSLVVERLESVDSVRLQLSKTHKDLVKQVEQLSKSLDVEMVSKSEMMTEIESLRARIEEGTKQKLQIQKA